MVFEQLDVAALKSFIQPGKILMAVALIGAGIILNRISKVAVSRLADTHGLDRHASETSKTLTAYLVYSFTLVAVLGSLGVPLSALSTVVGLLGLGISFALKDVISNFISGILLMIYRPVEIGDQIQVSGEEGRVQDIKTRSTDIKTFDGRKVIIPNSDLYDSKVINMDAYDSRRFEVRVGVGYDDDVDKAREAAMDVLENADTVNDDPDPQVLVEELGGSSVNLRLRGWTSTGKASQLQGISEVTEKIKKRYDEEGIDIPYPIRTVQMDGEEESMNRE